MNERLLLLSGAEKAGENHELPASVIEGRLIAVLRATGRLQMQGYLIPDRTKILDREL